jgi:hypothetical protein
VEGELKPGLNEFSGAKFGEHGEIVRNKSGHDVQQVGNGQQNLDKTQENAVAEKEMRLTKMSNRRAKGSLQRN